MTVVSALSWYQRSVRLTLLDIRASETGSLSSGVQSTYLAQVDDDDSIVSSLTLKLVYCNNTQHTAFFFKYSGKKRKKKNPNWQDTKYTKVPRLEKWLCILNIASAGGQFSLSREHHRSKLEMVCLHWSLWHCTESVSLHEIIDDGNVNYLHIWCVVI